MLRREPLVVLAQGQCLGGLNEAFGAVGVVLEFHCDGLPGEGWSQSAMAVGEVIA